MNPTRKRIRETVMSPRWELVHVINIVCDSIVIGWRCECLSRYTDCMEAIMTFFVIWDNFICVASFVTCCIEFFAYGRSFFSNSNLLSVLDTGMVIFFLIFGTIGSGNIFDISGLLFLKQHYNFFVMGRILRLTRLMKSAENLRAFQSFEVLYLLVRGLRDSLQTLLSSVFTLTAVITISSVIICSFVSTRISMGWSFTSKQYQIEHFSSVISTMGTLVRFVFIDDAMDIIEPLARDSQGIWYMFMGFIFLTTFLVINLIMALIVNQAFTFTKNDKQHLAQVCDKERAYYAKKVSSFFSRIDSDGNKSLTLNEFRACFENDEMSNNLYSVGITMNELVELFHILDTSGTGYLAINDFITGMQRIQGTPSSRDVLFTSQYVRLIFMKLIETRGYLDSEDNRYWKTQKDLWTVRSEVERRLVELNDKLGWTKMEAMGLLVMLGQCSKPNRYSANLTECIQRLGSKSTEWKIRRNNMVRKTIQAACVQMKA